MKNYDPTADRPTLRCFYPPREKTGKAYTDALLELRVAELEVKTADLTQQLADRTEELLDALNALEGAGRL